jgi:hypothetical protein
MSCTNSVRICNANMMQNNRNLAAPKPDADLQCMCVNNTSTTGMDSSVDD